MTGSLNYGESTPSSFAWSISNLGTLLGITWNEEDYVGGTYVYVPWEYSAGKFTPLVIPPGYSIALICGGNSLSCGGIDDAGQIAGTVCDGSQPCPFSGTSVHAYLDQKGKYTILDYPGSATTLAYSINGQGQIVGNYVGTDGYDHGFIYSAADGWQTLDYPDATSTDLIKINDNGQIFGTSDTAGAFVYYNGGFANLSSSLPTLPNSSGVYPTSINDFLDIVGDDNYCNGWCQDVGDIGQTQH
jgi:uncharacterized membrane protein